MRFVLLLLLSACFTRQAVMSRPAFETIAVGSTVFNLNTQVGDPYAIHDKGNGIVEYEYIERIPMGREILEQNHYFLVVHKNKIVAKRMNQETPPLYEFIFDLDITDNDQ